MNEANFLIKEESINCEETCDAAVKEEPTSPWSANIENDGDYENAEHDEFSKECYQTTDMESSVWNCSPQTASSVTQCTSGDAIAMDTQKHISEKSFSSEHETVLLPFAFVCCSTVEVTKGYEGLVDVEEQIAEERQKEQSDQSEGRSSVNHEETCFQRQTLRSDSVRSPIVKKSFNCYQCGKAFKRKENLITHIRIHTGKRPYKCPHCEKSFTQNSTLTKHIRKHTGERPYKCSECGSSFADSSQLRRHMRTHTGDRPYKCSQCGKCYTESGHLTVHMRKHTGDRPHKCSVCGKSFPRSSNLTEHMRTHTRDRPYKCPQCGKSFRQSGCLPRHMRLHSKDRPYKCSQCGKSFTQSTHLTKHMRLHT